MRVLFISALLLAMLTACTTHTLHFEKGSELSGAASTWLLPFDERTLHDARNISLTTDVDLNTFDVSWLFSSTTDVDNFVAEARKRSEAQCSFQCGGYGCNRSRAAACSSLHSGSTVTEYVVSTQPIYRNERILKSYWLVDATTKRVFGTSSMPGCTK